MPLALWALTISAFAIGTTEFVIVGLIPTMAQDLVVSLPSAGLLISFYALGVAIGAPILTALTGNVPRKRLLVVLMGVFTIGNLLAWWAPTYETLIAARMLTGLTHGVYFSIGAIIATSLVPKEKAGSAIAIMFSGLTVALVTSVPLGTFIGQHFGWRATFLIVSGFGVLAMLGALAFVPNKIQHTKPASLRTQLSILRQPRLLLVYAMTSIGYGGSLIAFTYLAPILEQISGFSASTVGVVLLVYGISVAVGNVMGGRLADRHGAVFALKVIFGVLAAVLFALTFTAHSKWMVVATAMLWGGVAFGNVPALQLYVVKLAEKYAPDSVNVASGLNIAAFNVGVAGGASGGGLIVEHFGLAFTPLVAALVVFCAFGLTVWSGRLDRHQQHIDDEIILVTADLPPHPDGGR